MSEVSPTDITPGDALPTLLQTTESTVNADSKTADAKPDSTITSTDVAADAQKASGPEAPKDESAKNPSEIQEKAPESASKTAEVFEQQQVQQQSQDQQFTKNSEESGAKKESQEAKPEPTKRQPNESSKSSESKQLNESLAQDTVGSVIELNQTDLAMAAITNDIMNGNVGIQGSTNAASFNTTSVVLGPNTFTQSAGMMQFSTNLNGNTKSLKLERLNTQKRSTSTAVSPTGNTTQSQTVINQDHTHFLMSQQVVGTRAYMNSSAHTQSAQLSGFRQKPLEFIEKTSIDGKTIRVQSQSVATSEWGLRQKDEEKKPPEGATLSFFVTDVHLDHAIKRIISPTPHRKPQSERHQEDAEGNFKKIPLKLSGLAPYRKRTPMNGKLYACSKLGPNVLGQTRTWSYLHPRRSQVGGINQDQKPEGPESEDTNIDNRIAKSILLSSSKHRTKGGNFSTMIEALNGNYLSRDTLGIVAPKVIDRYERKKMDELGVDPVNVKIAWETIKNPLRGRVLKPKYQNPDPKYEQDLVDYDEAVNIEFEDDNNNINFNIDLTTSSQSPSLSNYLHSNKLLRIKHSHLIPPNPPLIRETAYEKAKPENLNELDKARINGIACPGVCEKPNMYEKIGEVEKVTQEQEEDSDNNITLQKKVEDLYQYGNRFQSYDRTYEGRRVTYDSEQRMKIKKFEPYGGNKNTIMQRARAAEYLGVLRKEIRRG